MKRAVTVVLTSAMLGLPGPAAAGYDPVASGTTTITLDPSFRTVLRENGIRLEASGGARMQGAGIAFPVSGGRVDPLAARGSVEHAGALVFSAGMRRLPMKALQLKTTQARSPLAAKFGGGKLRLSESSRLATGRAGFGFAARVSRIRLSAKVAVRLNKKLRLPGAFAEGQLLGRSRTVAQPERVAVLSRGRASLELAAGFAAKLQGLFVAVNPIFPAEHPGQFTFPLTGRDIAPDGSGGTVRCAGALELLQRGGGQIFWAEPYLDLDARQVSLEVDVEPSPKFPGKLGRIAVFELVPGTVVSDPKARSVSVTVAVNLPAQTATTLNEAFAEGKNVFEAGEAMGAIGFTAQTQ